MTNGAFGATRTAALERVGMVSPLLERHVATAIAVPRCMEYSGTRSPRCPSRYESDRHLETSTLPYMVVLGQVSMQLVGAGWTHPSSRCILNKRYTDWNIVE